MNLKPKADVCFEVSFESGNKVGGIYTVLVSKSKQMKKYYGENYYTIGFFNPQTYFKEFEELEIPKDFEKVFKSLEKEGIICHWGRWITAEDVNLILIDSRKFMKKLVKGIRNVDRIKKWLWENFKVDSLRMGHDYDEPVAWSVATGMLIEKLVKEIKKLKNKKIVVHFHEWLSGAGLLYLLKQKVPVGLIFTTHATRIGRAKSSSGEDLIKEVEEGIKKGKRMKDEEAYKFQLEGPHLIEKACANNAHVFTTVSEIVALEAKYVLGKWPDVITTNGLDFSRFPSIRTLTILHEKFRSRINKFLEAYFTPYYTVDTKNNIIFFISGRYEFYNKGIDIFIEALSKLNRELKEKNAKKNVFAFILIPTDVKGPRDELLESLVRYEKIHDLVEQELINIKDGVVDSILKGEKVKPERMISSDFITKAKVLSSFFKRFRSEEAPLSAFELINSDDRIMKCLRKHKLMNKKDDVVKVVFYPTYLSVTDGLLGMEYHEFVIGATMGVFPSRYEPWGYTPFETSALRALALTTDVSGFGCHLLKTVKEKEKLRNRVIKMKGVKRDEVIKNIVNAMKWAILLGKDRRPIEKIVTRELAEIFDWEEQIRYYIEAHNLAMGKLKKG